jgi:NAD(P)-dependent dehydrogenase (short-subunit alcohol dehydrogenase family)
MTDMSLDQFMNTIHVNLTGTFLFTKHFLRNLDINGPPPSIILIGSTAGRFGEAGHADCLHIQSSFGADGRCS